MQFCKNCICFLCFSNFSGSNIDPGLIPRTLDYLFDALKSSSALSADPASTTKSIHKFKPDKFNEIVYLTDREYAQEMSAKESILRFASGPSKAGLERVESLDLGSSVRTAAATAFGQACSLEASKKFGSLDSLSTVLTSLDSRGVVVSTSSELPAAAFSPLSKDKKYAIWISFYELYNDAVYDLLTLPSSNKNAPRATMNMLASERPSLKIREDANRIPYVEGLFCSILFCIYLF